MTKTFNKGSKRYCTKCKRVISLHRWRRHKKRCGEIAKTKQFNILLKRGMGSKAFGQASRRDVMRYLYGLQRQKQIQPKPDEEPEDESSVPV